MVMVPYATTGKIVTGGTDSGQLVLLQRKCSLFPCGTPARNRRRSNRDEGSAMVPGASLSNAQDHCHSQGGCMSCEVCYQKWVELPGKAACRAQLAEFPDRGWKACSPP